MKKKRSDSCRMIIALNVNSQCLIKNRRKSMQQKVTVNVIFTAIRLAGYYKKKNEFKILIHLLSYRQEVCLDIYKTL